MTPATEYDRLESPSGAWELALWHAYDPANKVELHASALTVRGHLFFVDPIQLQTAVLDEFAGRTGARPAGVLMTNGNHARAAARFAARFGLPLVSSDAAAAEAGLAADFVVPPEGGVLFGGVIEAVPLPGAGLGEMAYGSWDGGGLVIVGDALINFPPYDFSVLPAKYCEDLAQLRPALEGLAARRFEVMAFAHGDPLVQSANRRLRELLVGRGE